MHRILNLLSENKDNIKLSWTHLAAFPVSYPAPVGCMGNQGSMGPPGAYGVGYGPQGSQGYCGEQGVQGVQGIYGAQGFYGKQGCQGMTGVIGTTQRDGKRYRIQSVPRTKMPDVLEFTFEFLQAKGLFEEFYDALVTYSPNKPKMVSIQTTAPTVVPRPRRLKEEFTTAFEEKKIAFEKKKQKIALLIEMATELGACLDEGYWVPESDLFMPPDNYEEYGPVTFTPGRISVLCSHESDIYKALDKAGLLQQYCPEAYRRGDAYSVNGGPMHKQPTEEVLIE